MVQQVRDLIDQMVVELRTVTKTFWTEEDSFDELYELPRQWKTDSDGIYFQEYAIHKIEKGIVWGIGVGETDNEVQFFLEQLSYETICELYDLVHGL